MSITEKLNAVPDVEIDEGTYKYIQIRVKSIKEPNIKKIVIRGIAGCEFHADVFDMTHKQIEALGFSAEAIGGGRIKHDPQNKTIFIYGYSIGFGRADHTITVEKVQDNYPGYDVSYSNDGY